VSYAYAKDHHEEFTGLSSAAVQAEIDRLAARKAAE
jgi:limonene 1,2-monooxygenase